MADLRVECRINQMCKYYNFQPQTQALPPAAPPAPAAPAAPAARSPSPVQQDQGHTAIALYDYTAGEDNEISFKENQTITHIEFVSEDWWQGVAADGKSVGLFPGMYPSFDSCFGNM